MSSHQSQRSTWRPILPRGDRLPSQLPEQSSESLPSVRGPISVACESCRRSKIKCNGTRPSCRACACKNRQCIYRAEAGESGMASLKRQHRRAQEDLQRLRKSHDTLQRLVSALQTREDSEVATIVRHLRDAQDPEAIARQLEGGDLLLQLHVHPEAKFRFTFPYRRAMPRVLLTPENAYLKSPLYESTFEIPNPSAKQSSRIETQQAQYFRPYASAQIADCRLKKVDIARWTSVCADNRLLRTLLHSYLLTDYQAFPFFHKDHFLDDMLLGKTRFCSPLLVNAILAHACTCHQAFPNRIQHWNPHSLGYKFFAEARRLWDMERVEPKVVTTVQAGLVINVIYNVYSMDKVGLSYGAQAAALAHQLGLFKAATGALDPDLQAVCDYTAWCLYFSISFQCYHLMTPSPLQHEPAAVLPDPDLNPGWYGEFLLQYPSNQTLVAVNYPQWTRFKFELWCILRPVASYLFDERKESEPEPCQQLYTGALDKMKKLYSALPAALSPVKVVFPLHMVIHLWYHNIVFNLCQLLIPETSSPASLETRNAAEAQLLHSKICFETIIRLYYLRNGYDGGNMLLLHGLAVLSFMALRDVQSLSDSASESALQEDTRSTLILAAKGLYDQGKNYLMSAVISRVLQSQMAAQDLDLLGRYCTSTGEDPALQQARAEHIKTQYPLNIVDMTKVPEDQRLENMMRQYEKLAVQQVGQHTDEG